ncbi:MAG TPA: type III-B CRISPR module RAMP protein Cmr4 [Thermoanaerobaculia bacterium]|nr:type III-B CRISPR module RAMP protein Cmr4 [Thermoanaerobaculia bacterium]
MLTRLVFVHALSPLHAGTGQSVGAIDLPIARERPTGIPLVPGSSIKGALRARSGDRPLTREVFGPDTTASSEHAGSVHFSDAHLVLLPVRSIAGTFAWVTSPYLLRRLARDAREASLELPACTPAPAAPDRCTILGATLTVGDGAARRVVLEDLDFTPTVIAPGDASDASPAASLPALAKTIGELLFPDGSPDAAGWRTSFAERLCLVHDDVMALLLDTATEVSARVRLDDDTKTVAKGALWYEEALPAETVLAGLAVAGNTAATHGREARQAGELLAHVQALAAQGMIQLGGKAGVGRGSCVLHLAGGAA